MTRRGGRETILPDKGTRVDVTAHNTLEVPSRRHIGSKAGMSPSKVWRSIRRLFESFDVTFDLRSFAPILIEGGDEDAVPSTARREDVVWSRDIRPGLEWVRATDPLVGKGLTNLRVQKLIPEKTESLDIGNEPLNKVPGTGMSEHQGNAVVHFFSLALLRSEQITRIPERAFRENATWVDNCCHLFPQPRGPFCSTNLGRKVQE